MDEIKEVAIGLVILALVATGAVYALGLLKEEKCRRQWADSGIPVQWGWLQGCRIDPKANGRWIPADNYRDQT